MHPDFDLVVIANDDALTAELRLLDRGGTQIGYHLFDIRTITAATLQGLFNLREFVRMYAAKPGESGRTDDGWVANLGVSIAHHVLGSEIFGKLAKSDASRTMRVRLPVADTSHLAAALARVPWEIAREAEDQPTLAEKNLIVRAVVDADPSPVPLTLGKDEALRVLFIFAEAPGSRPLAARQEREQLIELFEREIYPKRRIEADILAHGVTRDRLIGIISDRHGYHVVHWSGHGHQNLLELTGTDGKPDRLSGEDLVQLLREAGGFKPQLFFLSACHSGNVLSIRDWAAFQAVAEGRDPPAKIVETADDALNRQLQDRPGYTGTAHALLRAGIPSVVAMRYAVGDDYARDLAVDFYRAVLAATNPPTVAEALNLSRKRLRSEALRNPLLNYGACDHATPVLFGLADPGLPIVKGKSHYKSRRDPRLGLPIRELEIREHPYFVGRTWELAGLGANFIGYQKAAEIRPVTLVQGIGGMGKTALVAEALDLWEKQFDWVLLFQAKPNPLNLDNTLREIHELLYAELKTYHAYVQENPADAIWRPAEGDGEYAFRGKKRMDRLIENLARAMADEAILLVLDNFETNLKEQPQKAAGDPVWACQDPTWDDLLRVLATELTETASRVLITSRRPLAALPTSKHYRLLLGPLPATEAALFMRSHPGLRRLLFSTDASDRELAERLFLASRFHPLLLDRLAQLVAGGAPLREQLEDALHALEGTSGYTNLPELFAARAAGSADTKELEYLHDALESSIDLLLSHAGAEARRLLWIIALANDPVTRTLLFRVWSGDTVANDRNRQLKEILARVDQLPPHIKAEFALLPANLVQEILATPSPPRAELEIYPLIDFLTSVGLVTAQLQTNDDGNPEYTCHELVRERIFAWIASHSEERLGQDQDSIRIAYADWLQAAFEGMLHTNATKALEAGRRALVYCVQAGAYDRLSNFASWLVTSATDRRLLNLLLPHLEAAVEAAPPGRAHWSSLTCLADALDNAGRTDAGLPFYEQAVAEAKAANEWSDVATITGNWAAALLTVRYLDASREKRIESANAARLAGSAEINVIGSELEAYRVDILKGHASEVIAEVETRLAKLEDWWNRTRNGKEAVREAPDVIYLARALLSGLDIAREAHVDLEDWNPALKRAERILEVELDLHRPESAIAASRLNRAVILMHLNRQTEAQKELEACLKSFEGDAERSAVVLSALASLFHRQGDPAQAVDLGRRALAIREQFNDPQGRMVSHNNLGNYLRALGNQAAIAEAAYHQLADLVYVIAAGMGATLQTSLQNYAGRFREAKNAGVVFQPPRLADLLALPAFRSLTQWLDYRRVNPDELQRAIDQQLEVARKWGES